MEDNANDVINELLQDYERELSRLQQEQRLLEDAPSTFVELASRLHAEVERRSAADRRSDSRETPDRRRNTVGPADSSAGA